MKPTSTYPLRLPLSIKAALQRVAKRDGMSMNQFVVTAVAEKNAAMETAEFFTERRKRADLVAFRKLLQRQRGEPPRPGDETT